MICSSAFRKRGMKAKMHFFANYLSKTLLLDSPKRSAQRRLSEFLMFSYTFGSSRLPLPAPKFEISSMSKPLNLDKSFLPICSKKKFASSTGIFAAIFFKMTPKSSEVVSSRKQFVQMSYKSSSEQAFLDRNTFRSDSDL